MAITAMATITSRRVKPTLVAGFWFLVTGFWLRAIGDALKNGTWAKAQGARHIHSVNIFIDRFPLFFCILPSDICFPTIALIIVLAR